MLELKNIVKIFHKGTIHERLATDNLSLVLNDGDFTTIIGTNGAGKSTVLNIIAGAYDVDGGKIILDDIDITNMPEHKRAKYLGRVFQDPMQGTAPNMQIEENLAIAKERGKRRGLSWCVKNEDREIFKKELSKLNLGLEKRLKDKVNLLSGGQRQAVTLLMATLNKPKLLLLDEHTAALDPKTAELVLTLTDNIVRENNLTTLMVTHNMRDAIKYGNRLIMMDKGCIIYDVSGEEKKKLTIDMLLKKFEEISVSANDNMVLG